MFFLIRRSNTKYCFTFLTFKFFFTFQIIYKDNPINIKTFEDSWAIFLVNHEPSLAFLTTQR